MDKAFLDQLTPESIQHNPFPLREVLEHSVFYLASGFDGGLIRDFNRNRQDMDVLSFIYCDYHKTEQELHKSNPPRGYRLLGERNLKKDELTPNKWILRLPCKYTPNSIGMKVKRHMNQQSFATWMVFERLPGFGKEHGPDRFSLLFLCFEGVTSYQALYWSNNCVPFAIAIIQPGVAFGGAWTNPYKKGELFRWMVLNNPAGLPEHVYTGHIYHGATRSTANPDGHSFDWPEYDFVMPAVGYPSHEVLIYKNGTSRNNQEKRIDDNHISAMYIDFPESPVDKHLRRLYKMYEDGIINHQSGWGYSKEDAIIVNAIDKEKKTELENYLAHFRSRKESMRFFNASYDKFEIVSSRLENCADKWFDVLSLKIHLHKTRDAWKILETAFGTEWNVQNEDGNDTGFNEVYPERFCSQPVLLNRNVQEKSYQTEIWFDITQLSPYGKTLCEEQ